MPTNPDAKEARNGRAPIVLGIGGAVSGIIVAVSTIVWNQLDTARTEAQTSLSVAAQHGVEMNSLREEQSELRQDLKSLRRSVDTVQTRLELLIDEIRRAISEDKQSR